LYLNLFVTASITIQLILHFSFQEMLIVQRVPRLNKKRTNNT